MKLSIIFLLCLTGLFTACKKAEQAFEEPSKITVNNNIVYGNANNFAGITQPLLLDIYTPKSKQALRPLIVFIHGGHFYWAIKMKPAKYVNFLPKKDLQP